MKVVGLLGILLIGSVFCKSIDDKNYYETGSTTKQDSVVENTEGPVEYIIVLTDDQRKEEILLQQKLEEDEYRRKQQEEENKKKTLVKKQCVGPVTLMAVCF